MSISKCIIGIVSFNDDKLVTTVREELGYGKVREGGWEEIRGGKGLKEGDGLGEGDGFGKGDRLGKGDGFGEGKGWGRIRERK